MQVLLACHRIQQLIRLSVHAYCISQVGADHGFIFYRFSCGEDAHLVKQGHVKKKLFDYFPLNIFVSNFQLVQLLK